MRAAPLAALAAGFPIAIAAAWLSSRSTAPRPHARAFSSADHGLSDVIANPDAFSVIVAFCAGVAGMLSLTTAKSSVLIGVLISVTTIPAAANVASRPPTTTGARCAARWRSWASTWPSSSSPAPSTLAMQRAVSLHRRARRT